MVQPSQDVRSEKGLTGRHVLLAFLGFFGVVFAINAWFVSVALSTHTGVVANEPYRKGLKYNERIAAAEQQASLGWTDNIALSPDGGRLTVSLEDSGGRPVRGLEVTATIGRAATNREDALLKLIEAGDGRYEAPLALTGEGAFVAAIEARATGTGSETVLYRARSRLWLKR